MEGPRLIHAECVAAMRKLPARSVDHTITDPPYSEKTHAKGKRYKRGANTLKQWTATDRAMRATPQWYHEPRATWPAHVDAGTLPEPVYAEWLSEMDRRRENMRDEHN